MTVLCTTTVLLGFLAISGCSATLQGESASVPSEQEAVQTFIESAGCQSDRWDGVNRKCPSKMLDAFAFEAQPESILKAVGSDHAQVLERWVDSLPAANKADGSDFMTLGAYPEQIHISVTPTIGNVSVVWTTNTSVNTSQVGWWSANSDVANATGYTWTFDPVSIIPWTGNIHGGFMTGLVPGREYCYTVSAESGDFSSGVHCFTCPNLEVDATNQTEWLFAVGGDMGSYQLVGHLVAAQMRADEVADNLKYDGFYHLGDIAYSTLDPPRDNFEFFWDIYMRQEQSLADHVPLMVTYGNHDFGGGDSASYRNRFANPSDPTTPTGHSLGANPFYWTYDHGPIRYVSMCTEQGLNPVQCDYSPGSVQYQWLEQQFATINRTKTPWLILAGHRPMYSSDKSVDSGPLRRYIEPLLAQYNVDVELAGHMHETEVIAPVNDFIANMTGVTILSNSSFVFEDAKATAHLTVGTLGAVIEEHWDSPKPEWSLFHRGALFNECYGYVQLRATKGQLSFEFKRQKDNSTMWSLQMRK